MLTSPLAIDVRRGAIADLGTVLADRRIANEGRIAVAVGPGQGSQIAADLDLPNCEVFQVDGGSVDVATELGKRLRAGAYEAVAGIGGGKTIDVTKFAASMAGIPMVAVATNLSHDGIASPVSSLEHESGKASIGVTMPIAVVVDVDYVRAAPERLVRSGIGDVVSNLSAIDDWELAGREQGEPVDGMAVTFARVAAEAVLHRPDSIESQEFLTALAEALVLSGMAMSVAGSSRPASGACHEVLHAIDQLFPGTSNHGELAGIGALYAYFLRTRHLDRGESRMTAIRECLLRHRLPIVPADVGLDEEQFAQAVALAPSTRPGRYTILEHLNLSDDDIRRSVGEYVKTVGR
ncbi:iron-containing alcohol dehydrogenase family protein [Marinitenerispora sediminis]|uniref:3-dehydroquinate synthase n=1 Tax=Marinitenerispora sediminis TaxID=1931232 RepID=A0A368T859_9ACTN|nr:iron-containing alcohol dehydrogenase family protein [Marinitenerispora sediminis]RCV54324.1 3-dehydroquinate synthase [Marinitenerispora sediminis]RCV60502.1 3-dehydroquinate synthase [Marinitenerispora sediminis]RCV61054.1 3-dehydroquinate synthase [Marinitenerispora sediminis]